MPRDRNADSNRRDGHQRTRRDTRARDLVLPRRSPLLSTGARDYGSEGWASVMDYRKQLLHFAAEAHRRKWEFVDDPAAFDALHRLGNELLAAYKAAP